MLLKRARSKLLETECRSSALMVAGSDDEKREKRVDETDIHNDVTYVNGTINWTGKCSVNESVPSLWVYNLL